MPGLVVLDVLDDLGSHLVVRLVGAHRLGADDVGLGDLAGAGVLDGDDCAVGDEIVDEEVGFQFCGGDLMALGVFLVLMAFFLI